MGCVGIQLPLAFCSLPTREQSVHVFMLHGGRRSLRVAFFHIAELADLARWPTERTGQLRLQFVESRQASLAW